MSISTSLGSSTVHKLNLIAANGTDALKAPIQTIHPQIDPYLNSINTDNDAVKVLFVAGLLTMRRQAGFNPQCDMRHLESTVEPDDEHQQVAYSSDILEILTHIYHGQFPEIYAEWLHWVALEEAAFPYEAIPLMLTLATYLPNTRDLTKRVIGSRGRWLVEYSKNSDWSWSRNIKPARRPRLTKHEKYEARVTLMLQKVRYQRIPVAVTNELRKMDFPWSMRFSKMLTTTIETMLNRQNQMLADDLARLLDSVKWHIHPKQNKHLIDVIKHYNSAREFQTLAYDVSELLEFRAKLTAVFEMEAV